jgi:hypothetical protein
MLSHLLRLLERSAEAFPSLLGGNWVSLILPLIIFILAEGNDLRKGGLIVMKERVQKNTLFLLCAYGLLFIWAVVHTTYRDHVDLVVSAQRSHQLLQGEQSQGISCSANLDKANSTVVDKQSLIDTLQQTLVASQGPQQQQAANIASCITNLAKMNPIIRLRTPVIMVPFATQDVQGRIDPKNSLLTKYITELFILTNVEQQTFSGILECANPFTILQGPNINSESRLITNGTPPPMPKGDRSYEIRVEQSNTVWNTSHPAYLRVIGNEGNPGGCKFTPTE